MSTKSPKQIKAMIGEAARYLARYAVAMPNSPNVQSALKNLRHAHVDLDELEDEIKREAREFQARRRRRRT